MKRLLTLLMLATVMFAACEHSPIEETQNVMAESYRSLQVSFEDNNTRIQLDDNHKTVWTKDDRVSVFYRSNVNEEWRFMGETGDRTGVLNPVDNSICPPQTLNRVVVVYPYNNDYFFNTETYNIQASLPEVQNYLEGSYGLNGNIMISSNEADQVSLKSVCGWLKLQLTGDGEVVKSINFRGNNNEQVAGRLYIHSSDATCVLSSTPGDATEGGSNEDGSEDTGSTGGSLVRPGTVFTEVTLDCGEGVALSSEATAFYIALPPQTFENGFTVEITAPNGATITKETTNALDIQRNCIQPMKAFEVEYAPIRPANNEIWYTNGSTTEPITPGRTSYYGMYIVSNTYDTEKECWVITFEKDVTYIGEEVFTDCDNLISITIPESVTEIYDNAFRYCNNLESITMFEGIVRIGEAAFMGCNKLTEITIPESVRTIEKQAFYSCYNLTSIKIPNNITTIGEEPFALCSRLREFKGNLAMDDGRILVLDNTIIAFAAGCGATEYTIPEGITTIGRNVFYNCDSLKNITIGSDVRTIGECAFNDCSGLTDVIIPDNVTTLEYWAFGACNYLKNITIGRGVTSIGRYAFYMCDRLTNVYIKATTPPTPIHDYNEWNIFDYNDPERKIYVPATSIDAYKTADYWSTYAYVIGGYDFANDEIVIPCPQPKNNEIWYTSSSKVTDSWTFATFGANITSHKHDYPTGRGVITFDRDVTTIGDNAFDSKYITSIDIPNSVTSIGVEAFKYCNGLKNITIPNSVTSIGHRAFEYCSSLTSITIPKSITSIGANVFGYCEDLTVFKGVYAEDGGRILVINGKLMAFAPCGLTTYTIPNNVTSIGEYSFMSCDYLNSIIIPSSVTEIGNRAFYACRSLTSIYCMSTIPPTLSLSSANDRRTFDFNADNRIIYVPNGSGSAYRSANGWSEYASYIREFQYIPTECTSLTITADDVVGNATSTTIYYTADTNGIDCYGEPKSQTVTGTAQSSKFSINSSTTESIERTITFTYLGQTATTTITQGPSVDSQHTISTNNQWRLSSSIANPDSSLYDGVYESYSNYNVDGGIATMYIDITGYSEFSIYIRSNAESSYDYVTVSELDSTSVKKSTSGNQNSGTSISSYTKVTYTGIDGGSHRITVTYRKDSAVNNGTDRGYLLIPKYQ